MAEPAEQPSGDSSLLLKAAAVAPGEAPLQFVPASQPTPSGTLLQQIRPLLLSALLLTLLTGAGFPLLLAALACPFLPHQAAGSLVERNGIVVGSELIGQKFNGPAYFHTRPSAANDGYDGLASGGSNLSPTNPKLREDARQLADAYRKTNGLAPESILPIDAITRSGSGLDPHISRGNADLQVRRVAQARGLEEAVVRRLVAEHTRDRQLGLLGEPRVEVLALNLALDLIFPLASR